MHRYTVRGPGGRESEVVVIAASPRAVEVQVDSQTVRIEAIETPAGPMFRTPSGRVVRARVNPLGAGSSVSWAGASWTVERAQATSSQAGAVSESRSRRVRAQMPGRVVKVLVRPGDRVEVGRGLVILEAMKMENEVKARREGTVARVSVAEGDRVETGAELVEFE